MHDQGNGLSYKRAGACARETGYLTARHYRAPGKQGFLPPDAPAIWALHAHGQPPSTKPQVDRLGIRVIPIGLGPVEPMGPDNRK